MNEQLMTQEELAFRWKISEATLERDRSLKQGVRYLKIGGLTSKSKNTRNNNAQTFLKAQCDD